MADPWPAALPTPMIENCAYVPQDNQVRSAVAAGVAKTRRRYTAVAEDVQMTIPISRDQYAVLDEFMRVTLGEVLPFQWEDFRFASGPGNVRLYRFKSRPRWTPSGTGDRGRATLDLELLP